METQITRSSQKVKEILSQNLPEVSPAVIARAADKVVGMTAWCEIYLALRRQIPLDQATDNRIHMLADKLSAL